MLTSIATNTSSNTESNTASNVGINVASNTENNRNIIIPNPFNVSKFVEIMIFHILSNSIMNIINIVISDHHPENNIDEYLQVLMLFSFFKIF